MNSITRVSTVRPFDRFLIATKNRPSVAKVVKAAEELLHAAHPEGRYRDRSVESLTWPRTRVRESVQKRIADGTLAKPSLPDSVAFAISPKLVVVAALKPVIVHMFDNEGKEIS
jgi:hypothetical protein